eukprot:Rmarinus@m.2536
MVIGSIIAKVSIPVLHSAAGLMKIALMDYSGANSLFIRVLLDKKYNLPRQTITAVSAHFYKFVDDDRVLPVLWQKSLLAFAQRYRNDISIADKERLREVMKIHEHSALTPEIRRELFQTSSNTKMDTD